MLLDLDGFKVYNDTYGHPAGDALLALLGRRLAAATQDGASAYRLGGDEFCVLSAGAELAQEQALSAAAALSEHGDGFDVTSSFGVATMPKDAQDSTEALRIADQRMYTQKHGRESSAGRQSKNVLLRAIAERSPGLVDHVTDVAELAVDVARLLELPEHEIEQVRHAAELHDVGKVAIPDAILQKRGALSAEEWQFVHEHTLIGARIISAAPALSHVAKLVRSSHERWDGEGYPDRLAGEAIPIGCSDRDRVRRPGGDGDGPPVPGGCRPARRSRGARPLRRQPVRSRRRHGPDGRADRTRPCKQPPRCLKNQPADAETPAHARTRRQRDRPFRTVRADCPRVPLHGAGDRQCPD